jgi:hypothetical protein
LSKDNEASSSRETVYETPKYEKYDTKYLSSGFTYIDVDGEERPQCQIYIKILATVSMKPNKRGILKLCMLNVLEKYLKFSIEN